MKIEDVQKSEYNDLRDMVFLMELKYSEIENILDVKYTVASSVRYTQPPGIYEKSDLNLRLKTSLPNGVRVKKTMDDIRLRSNSNTNKTISFSKKHFFIHNIRFHSILFSSFR